MDWAMKSNAAKDIIGGEPFDRLLGIQSLKAQHHAQSS